MLSMLASNIIHALLKHRNFSLFASTDISNAKQRRFGGRLLIDLGATVATNSFGQAFGVA